MKSLHDAATFIEQRKEKQKKCYEYFVIGVDSKWKGVFDMLVLLFVGYSTTMSAFFVAFSTPSLGFQIVDIISEVIFVADLILKFFTAYRNSETNKEVKKLHRTAFHYVFKSTFILDLLAIFPFIYIFNSEDARISRLVRLFRIPKFIDLLDISKFN